MSPDRQMFRKRGSSETAKSAWSNSGLQAEDNWAHVRPKSRARAPAKTGEVLLAVPRLPVEIGRRTVRPSPLPRPRWMKFSFLILALALTATLGATDPTAPATRPRV